MQSLGERLVAVIAGRDTGNGIDGESLIDLTDKVTPANWLGKLRRETGA
jgi:hypothetical protein